MDNGVEPQKAAESATGSAPKKPDRTGISTSRQHLVMDHQSERFFALLCRESNKRGAHKSVKERSRYRKSSSNATPTRSQYVEPSRPTSILHPSSASAAYPDTHALSA
jgi:hypothetical protein